MNKNNVIGIVLIIAATPLLFLAFDNIDECRMAGTSTIIDGDQGHLPTCGDSTVTRALYLIIFILIAVVSYVVLFK